MSKRDRSYVPDRVNNPFVEDCSSSEESAAEESEHNTDIEECFCLCQGPEDGFMVECDGCKDWFHGDCVDLVEEEDEKDLLGYACPTCEEKGKAETTWENEDAEERYLVRREEREEKRKKKKEALRKKVSKEVAEERARGNEQVLREREKKAGHTALVQAEDASDEMEEDLTTPVESAPAMATTVVVRERQAKEIQVDSAMAEETAMPVDDAKEPQTQIEMSLDDAMDIDENVSEAFHTEGSLFVPVDYTALLASFDDMETDPSDPEKSFAFYLVKGAMKLELDERLKKRRKKGKM